MVSLDSACSQVVLVFTTWTIVQGFSVKDECVNLYRRYCDVMTSDKCYLGFNKQLCCATCAEYNVLYSGLMAQDDAMACPYGDRAPRGCDSMRTNRCYAPYTRRQCCATCAAKDTGLADCRYGDRDAARCAGLSSHQCYDPDVRDVCCGTCAQYNTGRQDCQYGDHLKIFENEGKWYNCQAWIGYFGYERCEAALDTEHFARHCCHSCQDFYRRRKSAWRYGRHPDHFY